MPKVLQLAAFLVAIALFTLGIQQNAEEEDENYLNKVLNSPKISADLKFLFNPQSPNKLTSTSIIIEFAGGNLEAVTTFENSQIGKNSTAPREERISSLVEYLERHASASQSEVVDFLNSVGAEYWQLWVSNELSVNKLNITVISEIIQRFENVSLIRPERAYKPLPAPVRNPDPPISPVVEAEIPQPIQQIKGRCKDIDCLGEGIVVAVIDTGVLWTHDELIDNYRQEYGWFDPFNGTEFPWFQDHHGTHVAGIILGKTRGVAPKAQWIACLGGGDFEWFETPIKVCSQWALCPSKWNDTNDKNCSWAPHIINNSWSAEYEQHSIPRNFFYGIQRAWNAAGIHTVSSAGNSGPYCTTTHPPGSYDISFSVGAVDNTSTVAWWSSRGPALHMEFDSGVDSASEGRRTCVPTDKQSSMNEWEKGGGGACTIPKPDITAPGMKINSSYIDSNNSYAQLSGTSMASPMVSGVIALMLCANNQAHGSDSLDVESVRNILTSTASTERINLIDGNDFSKATNFAKISHLLCNVVFGNNCSYPNNVYGWGEVDACAAVTKVKEKL